MSIFYYPFSSLLFSLLSFVPAALTEIWYVHADGELGQLRYMLCTVTCVASVCTRVNPVDDDVDLIG